MPHRDTKGQTSHARLLERRRCPRDVPHKSTTHVCVLGHAILLSVLSSFDTQAAKRKSIGPHTRLGLKVAPLHSRTQPLGNSLRPRSPFFFFSLGLGTLGLHDVRPLSGRPPAAPHRRRSGRHGRSSDRVSQASYKSPVLPGSGTFRVIVVVGCPMSRVKPLVRAFGALCQAEGGCRRYTCGDIRQETTHVRAGG